YASASSDVDKRQLEQNGFILAGFRNIDEMIRREKEQKEVLAEALAQAQYANNAKTTFLNNMSHDIRTPMNAIIGFTSLAVTHIDNKSQVQDYLGKIMTSSNHLLSLINDVLDMSRIESGKVKIEEKEVSLPDIMHDLKTIVQSDVKAKQLEFYIDTLDVVNETIICDKLRLNQVLLNILSNAMKYTKPGGMVSVRVIQTSEAQEDYASYEFRVKDTGIGMSPEFLKHVFEPFEREQTATVSGIQGTGLGLAITKNIVDMMGGTITVESEEKKGSEFIVTLRFRIADIPAKSQRLEQLADLRALVVDDDVNTCVSVSKMLSNIGMHPDWTTLGKEALIRTEFALDQNEPYSAYIIDWLMPDMNGIELVRRIRKIIGDIAQIIILTAYDWADIEEEAKEAGVTAFCSKPVFFSELRGVLAAPYIDKESADKTDKEEIRFDGRKILLVEDNELNQEIAQAILENMGFIIDTADDGTVAVEMIKKMPADTYDLILMDIQMPIMNGYQATRAIRALDDIAKAKIPIVAMTANAFEEDRQEAMEAGMNGHVAKPINIEKLIETLKDILK
ncbi:MAG: response regulator, partial [Ruminococcus sp.]|nr:response regulator [Ruminococcus sp.]